MAEENSDANTDAESIESAGSSPDVDMQPIIDEDGLSSTTEFEPVAKEESGEEANSGDDTSDDAEQNTSTDHPSKDFHEHPRFQELIAAKKESEQKIADLEAKINKPKSSQPKYKINWQNDEALVDAFSDNPKLFMTEMFQMYREENNRLDSIKSAEQHRVQSAESEKATYEKYFTETDGALDMWRAGDIQGYMDSNPGNTPISAHIALSKESTVANAVDSAVKKARQKWNKELKLKGRAASLSSDANPPKTATGDDELKNPDKYGGKKNVLVSRLKRMMAQ